MKGRFIIWGIIVSLLLYVLSLYIEIPREGILKLLAVSYGAFCVFGLLACFINYDPNYSLEDRRYDYEKRNRKTDCREYWNWNNWTNEYQDLNQCIGRFGTPWFWIAFLCIIITKFGDKYFSTGKHKKNI